MSISIAVTEARATLPQIVDRVERGEEVTLTRHGKPVAVLISPDSIRARRLADSDAQVADLRALMDQARAEMSRGESFKPTSGRTGFADERVAEIRADRDGG